MTTNRFKYSIIKEWTDRNKILILATTLPLAVVAVIYFFATGRLIFDSRVTPQAILGLFSLCISVILGILSKRVLQDIRASLSTKFLGEFPNFVPDIDKLAERSRRHLLIVCDHAGFGMISSRKEAQKYRSAVTNALARGVKVDCIFLTKEGCEAALKRQFTAIGLFKNSPLSGNVDQVYVDKLTTALRETGEPSLSPKTTQMNFLEFCNWMWKLNLWIRDGTFRGSDVKIRYSHGPLQLHFWIADDREAIFSVPNNTSEDVETAFHTGDKSLIKSLTSAAQRYRDDSLERPE